MRHTISFFRTLRRSPMFALVAIATLALGIGANTAMFSVVNAALLRPMPGYRSDRIVVISGNARGRSVDVLSPPPFQEVRRRATSFDSVAANNFCMHSFTGSGEPEQLAGPCGTASWFTVLRAQAMLGRTFLPQEGEHGAERVVVLDHAFWTRRFGADRTVIGRKILLDKQPWTVIGVMGPDFQPIFNGSIYTAQVPDDTGLWVIARLKDGVSQKAAAAELQALASRAPEFREFGIRIRSLVDVYAGAQRGLLLLLLGAAGLVLLIACVNVANLFLARGAARRSEIEIRFALGATRANIIRLVLAEALGMAVLAIAAAAALAWAMLRVLRPLLADLPRSAEISLDGTVFAWTVGIALCAAVLAGILPALRSAQHAGIAGMRMRATARWQGALVAGEVALAFVLLASAGLLLQSFAAMRKADLGYDPRSVLTAMISLEPASDGKRTGGIALYERLRERMARVPGIRGVATATTLPMGGVSMSMGVQPEGEAERRREHEAVINVVSPEYFPVIGIPLKAGRWFRRDDRDGTPRVAVVSESVSRRYFAGKAVGRRIIVPEIQFNLTGDKEVPAEIVGVAANVRVLSVGDEDAEHVYLPEAQSGIRMTYFVARTTGDPVAVGKDLRRAAAMEASDSPLDEMRTLESRAKYLTEGPRQAMWLISAFSGLALILAAVGIYGVAAYATAQRKREIGIRMALGADAAAVTTLVYRESLVAVASGLACGGALATGAGKLLRSLLFGLSSSDPVTLSAAGILLLGIALVATAGPALRAARTDPAVVLRAE